MKFLITTSVPSFGNVPESSPYVHFSNPSTDDLSIPLKSPETVDVWICKGEEVTGDLLDQWFSQASHIPRSILVKDTTAISRVESLANGRAFEVSGFPEQKGTITQWEESILGEAEILFARSRAHYQPQTTLVKNDNQKTNVLLVGAGIMNLMTAELLASRGYQVRVVDAGPDPRTCDDWTRLGVTNCGGNARMFTNTEADNYNEKGSAIYSNMKTIFRKTSRNGGWSVKDPEDFNDAENAWVNAFEQLPPWLARKLRDEIHSINIEAGKLWKEHFETSPQLYEDVELRRDILRLYVEQTALDVSILLNDKLGALIKAPSSEEFFDAYPGFKSAAESDHLAGGIFVDGFTVNIHPFMAKLMERIADFGGEFVWDCEVNSIKRNIQGEVMALESENGSLEADHYVLSPGIGGNKLLSGTASENLIQGILGIWLQIPNLEPKLQNSVKIHRRGHLVEDINITVAKDPETGEDILQFGGGYGYVGLDRPAADNPELVALFNELEQVARIYFPRAHAEAKKNGTLWPGQKYKYCIRPFTSTGLGVFERIPTANGGQLIISGGNNTGGFAQAPAVARAVRRSLVGENDPIHTIFHPDRGKLPSAVTYHSRFPSPTSLSTTPPPSQPPLKILLLCSDGPQHSYLRHQLAKSFPDHRCILETDSGQVSQLLSKRRYLDALWMKYHSLRRRFSGDSALRKAYFSSLLPSPLPSLKSPDLVVSTVNSRPVWDFVESFSPELTIVSGTKYIGRKLIDRAGLMINLHTGHLPEYKGNHCIFFALLDGKVDKVSSTLHQLTPLLDGGDVLDRVVPEIEEGDTEETLYAKCVKGSIERVIERAEEFARGKRLAFVKQENIGVTYRHRDRGPLREVWLWGKIRVWGMLRKWVEIRGRSSGHLGGKGLESVKGKKEEVKGGKGG